MSIVGDNGKQIRRPNGEEVQLRRRLDRIETDFVSVQNQQTAWRYFVTKFGRISYKLQALAAELLADCKLGGIYCTYWHYGI